MTERDQRTFWRQPAITRIGVMTVCLLLVLLIVEITRPKLEGAGLIAVGSLLALLPAALWLTVFHLQQRAEPQPKAMVPHVLILSAFMAAAVGVPLVHDVFRVQDWLGGEPFVEILGLILIVGFTQEFLKFAAVRWSVYPTAEFRERMDGIIYSTASSLGYTSVLNLYYVLDNQGVDLSVGLIRFTVTALAQASFATVAGYQLGRAKFDGGGIIRLPLGLILAATLNGIFTYGRQAVNQGLTINIFSALIIGLAWAVVTLPTVLYLMLRVSRKPVLQIGRSAADLRTSSVVLGMVLIALLIGWMLKTSAENLTRLFQSPSAGMSLNYPASWVLGTEEGVLVRLTDPHVASTFVTRFTARVADSGDKDIAVLTKDWTFRQASALYCFRVLAISPQAEGKSAVTIQYAYLAEPRAGLDSSPPLPVVVVGEDVLLLKGTRLYILSINADQLLFPQLRDRWTALVSSVRFE
jgi:RsiW-degrading membrane proteinase PrsW (M82 family)